MEVLVDGGRGPIVGEAMVPANNAEHHDMGLVVESFQLLPAPASGQARDHWDLPDRTFTGPISRHYFAGLDELLVGLRVVELPDDGPDQPQWGVDGLDEGRAALVVAELVAVME